MAAPDAMNTKGRLPIISVAVVDGSAIGGGAELTTCCDFRIAGPESVIRFVQVKVRASRRVDSHKRLLIVVEDFYRSRID